MFLAIARGHLRPTGACICPRGPALAGAGGTMRGRACLAEPAAGPAGWPDAGLGRYGLACYGRLAGLWMAVAGF